MSLRDWLLVSTKYHVLGLGSQKKAIKRIKCNDLWTFNCNIFMYHSSRHRSIFLVLSFKVLSLCKVFFFFFALTCMFSWGAGGFGFCVYWLLLPNVYFGLDWYWLFAISFACLYHYFCWYGTAICLNFWRYIRITPSTYIFFYSKSQRKGKVPGTTAVRVSGQKFLTLKLTWRKSPLYLKCQVHIAQATHHWWWFKIRHK